MADVRSLATLSDEALAEVLRGLAPELATPPVTLNGVDAAARSRALIEWLQARERREERPARRLQSVRARRSFRRSLVFAVAAVLVVAAIVAAVELGLPGLRIITATPSPVPASPSAGVPSSEATSSPSPSPSVSAAPGPPGSGLGLGTRTTLDSARRVSGFPLILPTDPRLGAPDGVWIDDVGRVTLVWTSRPGMRDTIVPGLSVILSEFPGSINPDYFEKILSQGTTIEPVRVDQSSGYWIAGAPHDFVYVKPDGEPDYDSRREAGDTLAWSMNGVTYRIETGLGEDSTVAIAAGMR